MKRYKIKNYIYTIPNFITLFRFLLIPFILYFIVKDRMIIVLTLFAISTLSDMFDGLLARKLNQSSYYGGMFDALTDTILILTTITFSYLTNHISAVVLVALLAPKIITFLLLTFLHKAEYKPTIFSRLSSLFFYLSIPIFLLDIHTAIEYLLIAIIYVLSLIHWTKLFILRFK
ncbi:CDP-alcohol phosphatidyltransferase family protein [Candidatus Woesearchaeota archaeon]|nr:CDP-alcohol phosphatidyltransferase family protein [Candidatus Woesearchaeota archaeon]